MDRVINRIMHLSCQRGLQRKDMKSACFERLSIDEKSFKKGHQYVSVLSDPASGCVLDVVEGRDKNACKQLCQSKGVPGIFGAERYEPSDWHDIGEKSL